MAFDPHFGERQLLSFMSSSAWQFNRLCPVLGSILGQVLGCFLGQNSGVGMPSNRESLLPIFGLILKAVQMAFWVEFRALNTIEFPPCCVDFSAILASRGMVLVVVPVWFTGLPVFRDIRRQLSARLPDKRALRHNIV